MCSSDLFPSHDTKSGGDTSELEGEIDVMVYKLYNLTQEEIDIVEGFK